MTKKRIDEIQWWHRVPLKDGRVTPGVVDPVPYESLYLFDRLDFRGKSVLDIGCWDGYFSFRAEARGASRVVGLDDPSFRFGGLDGWEFLHEHFESRAEWRKGTLYDPPAETFDIVLCFGVLYHLSDPLLGATNAFRLARERVAFESHFFHFAEAGLWLIEPGVIGGDFSNTFALSTGFLKTLARYEGFELREERVFSEPSRPNPLLDRGAMVFERVAAPRTGYLPFCFPKPPLNHPPAR